MAKHILSLTAFCLAAAAGVGAMILPWPAGAAAVVVLGAGYAAIVSIRDGETADDIAFGRSFAPASREARR